jgi:NADH-ubiquinone oxidoreductase chain 6
MKMNLHFLNEISTNGYAIAILDIISLLAFASAISVIVAKNPVTSVLFLIFLFLNVACYLIVIGVSFIGLSYLLVYVGAVSILFLFILMLINVRKSELSSETKNSIPLVILLAISFGVILHSLYFSAVFLYNNFNLKDFLFNKTDKGEVEKASSANINTWDGNLIESNHITSIGNILYTNYGI